MSRSLKTVIMALMAFIVLSALDGANGHDSLKTFVDHALPHLRIAVGAVFVAGLVVWIFEDAMASHIVPTLKAG